MSTFFFLVGMGLLAKAGWTYYSMQRWLANAQKTEGLVEDHAPGTFFFGNAHFAVVQFQVNGATVSFQDKWPVGTGSVGIGKTTTVWYNPGKPQDALVNAKVIQWSLPVAWAMPAFLLLMMSYTTRGL